MVRKSWLIGIILLFISFALLVLPTLIYVYQNEDVFFVSGFLGSRELYTSEDSEIIAILLVDYPDATEGDFVRIIDTDTDFDFKDGTWVNYNHMHAYVTTEDFLISFVIALIILAFVLLKALKNVDKMIAFPIWMSMTGFLLLFLKGVLIYLPNILFNVAIGWVLFYIFFKSAKRQFAIWNEYRNEKVRVIARSE